MIFFFFSLLSERGDTLGQTVGYTIRLESKATTNTRLLFCTTGILLKRLEEDEELVNVTHVFVDEVHERSIESDFLLMVLRDLIPKRKKPLKVVLMSATLDASLFYDYFWFFFLFLFFFFSFSFFFLFFLLVSFFFLTHTLPKKQNTLRSAPSVKFPGRTFPVTELYLEDAMEVTKHVVRGNEDWCRKGGGGGGGGGFRPSAGGSTSIGDPNKKPGDWTCPSCQVNNFARNVNCFRCGGAKQQGGMRSPSRGGGAPSKGGALSSKTSNVVVRVDPRLVPLADRDDEYLNPSELSAR